MAKTAGRRFVALVLGAAGIVPLVEACGLDTSGEAAVSPGSGDDATPSRVADGGGEEGCAVCSSSGDSSLPPPVKDASTDRRPEASSAHDGGGPADGQTQDCNNLCVTQTCGGPCGPGSECQAYLTCLILCGGSDASSCSSDCGSKHPTGALSAACTLACGAQCASAGGNGDGGSQGDGATD